MSPPDNYMAPDFNVPTVHVSTEEQYSPSIDEIVNLVLHSLGSGCVMDFTNKRDKTKKIPVWLAPKSIIVLKDEATQLFITHGLLGSRLQEIR